MSDVLSLVYADPPYIGCANLYPEHPDSRLWDDPGAHIDLMQQMDRDYDGWALSCHEPSLRHLAPVAAVLGARIAVWVKPFAAYKRNVRVAYTWEPVIWKRAAVRRADEPVSRDHLAESITLKKGLTGAKPEMFCEWVLTLLGYKRGDLVADLFPGTGVMGRVVAELEQSARPLSNGSKSSRETRSSWKGQVDETVVE
jgi:hypothetical protein